MAGETIFTRALRSSALLAGGYVASQGLRLASNLILTRLLYPEAFGLMALVSLVMVGLMMFADVGLGPAIQAHPRADEPAFLNTAYTLQLIRGGVLSLACVALAWPLAALYNAPELAVVLPVAGIQMLISGAFPTRIESASRHLALGRVTVIDLAAQVLSLIFMVGMAWATRSVWALVWGSLMGAALKLIFTWIWLPGHVDRPGWERASASVLVRYGMWIFLSTACGFLLLQGDKAILGLYLSLEGLGIYNVGYFLASFPMLLAGAVTGRVLIPLYARLKEDGAGPEARAKLNRMRFGLTWVIFALIALMSLAGPFVVSLLYDARYAAAGAVVVAVSLVQLPQLLVLTLDHAALAYGNSRAFFFITALRAGLQTALFLAGAQWGGLAGALCGQALAGVLALPASLWLARRNGVQDPRHDLIFALAFMALAALALSLHAGLLSNLSSL